MRLTLAPLLLLALATPAFAQDQTPDDRFKALYTAEWDWRKAQYSGDSNSDDTVSPHMPDVGAAAQAAQLAYWQDVEQKLAAIDPKTLSDEDQVNYAVYKAQIEDLVAAQAFHEYERPANSDSAFWSDIEPSPTDSFATATDYRNYISQLSEMPRYVGEQIDNMRAGLKRHFTPPQVTLEGRDQGIRAVTGAKSPQDTPFFAPFNNMPASIPADVQADLKAQAAKVIGDDVVPAYAKLLDFFDNAYVLGAQPALGAAALPDGAAYYQSKIKEFTTLDETPAQIHQTGLDEVAKIHAQMLEVMKEVGFQGDFPAFLHYLRTDPQFYAKTPQDLLDRAAWISKRFDGMAGKWFGHLPRQRFGIVPVPDAIAPFYTAGRGGPGVYLVNTYDLPSRPLFQLTALTLHESAPGHAFQMPLAAENKALPEFRQQTYISAYGEGWALYCERLGVEMGMYDTPYDRFGYLSYQMWRAARLVVDTGIHTMGWTRDQARQYMRDNTALSEHEIDTEVDRYISWPGQALSYYLGEMAIVAARDKAEKALGDKFNIRAFHDTVLSLGSVPLPVLTARIDRFIADGGVGPYPDEEK